jgi:hypothetical protein
MHTLSFTAALAALLGWAAGSGGADLTRVDRKIGKEPAYQTRAPRYCLLVFGPEARDRVWVVEDGESLYVDRNGNGDLTEAGEKVALKNKDDNFLSFEAGDLKLGGLTHTGLSVSRMLATADWVKSPAEFRRIAAANDRPWVWNVRLGAERPADDDRKLPKKISYVINGDGLGFLLFGSTPKDAPVVHLNGPWTLGLQDINQRLIAGHKSQLQIGVGTQGVGPGTFAFVLYPGLIPADAYPVAEVTFPPGQTGKPPPTARVVMKERC